jgi:hypothetical protein
MTKQYKWTLRLSLLTIPLLFIAVLFMGAGHGTYIPGIFLFPFGLVGSLFFDGITTPFIIIAFLQYPAYGLIIDSVKKSGKNQWLLFLVLFIHILLAMIVTGMTGEK